MECMDIIDASKIYSLPLEDPKQLITFSSLYFALINYPVC